MEMLKIIRLLVLFSFFSAPAHAANLWGVSWGDTFDTVKKRFPDAELLDANKYNWCQGKSHDMCRHQVILMQEVVGVPSKVIFMFSSDAKLNQILISVEEAQKYTPKSLGIVFEQIKAILTAENGAPIGATSFSLTSNPKPFQKAWLDGRAQAAWHTKDSIISVTLTVLGAASEDTPTNGSMLFIKYIPLRLVSSY